MLLLLAIVFGGILLIALVMGLGWWIYKYLQNLAVFEFSWALGMLVIASLWLCHAGVNPTRLFVLSLVGFWSGRLTGYLILSRLKLKQVAKKYFVVARFAILQTHHGLGFFMLSGLCIAILALPFLFLGQAKFILNWWQFILATLILCGIVGQTFADGQRYAQACEDSNLICRDGLWQYCRHPNYLCELVVWIGFALMALRVDFGWIALCSPLMRWWLIYFIEIPLSERALLLKFGEAYHDYQQQVPQLMPNGWKKFSAS